jgi:hypothetical protein
MKGLFSRKKKAKTVVCVDADVPTLEQLSKIMEVKREKESNVNLL